MLRGPSTRDFTDPAYKRWRLAVYTRDGFCCRLCRKGKRRLNAHHIRRWSDYPELRFVVSNGITLCRSCHCRVTGCEAAYEELFMRLVNPDSLLRIQAMLVKMKDEEKSEAEILGDSGHP